jgi:DNA-binding LytR/AlgR family response regulator
MIKCIVVDDEPPAVGILEHYISRVDYLHHLQSFTDPLAALSFINREAIDLVFLDINMPQLKGIDLVRSLNAKPMVVFTTAYPDYAVEGFQLHVLDYLVKPIAFERFLQTAQRAYDQVHASATATNNEAVPANEAYIFIKSGTRMHKVYLHDIYAIEGLREYAQVKTKGQKILTLTRLSELEEALQGKGFIRIHKSHIINISKIDSIEFNQVKVGDDLVPIGEKYKSSFEDVIRRKLI